MNLREHLIAINLAGSIGLKTLQSIESKISNLDELIPMSAEIMQSHLGLRYDIARFLANVYRSSSMIKEIELAQKNRISICTLVDDNYPHQLRFLADPPLALYINGNISFSKSAGIVGTRTPSPYGVKVTEWFSRVIASNNICIISGLAKGIDSVAHSTSVSVKNGITIAVLGSGLLSIYPRENIGLAERIADRGALVSEYPLGSMPSPVNFPMRNRIISALSDVLLVVQASMTSGALITCDWALEQGKQVYCVPGNLTDSMMLGCNFLIKDGAGVAISPAQVLSEVWAINPLHDSIEELILSKLTSPKTVRELISLTGLKEKVLTSVLQKLFQKCCIRRYPSGKIGL